MCLRAVPERCCCSWLEQDTRASMVVHANHQQHASPNSTGARTMLAWLLGTCVRVLRVVLHSQVAVLAVCNRVRVPSTVLSALMLQFVGRLQLQMCGGVPRQQPLCTCLFEQSSYLPWALGFFGWNDRLCTWMHELSFHHRHFIMGLTRTELSAAVGKDGARCMYACPHWRGIAKNGQHFFVVNWYGALTAAQCNINSSLVVTRTTYRLELLISINDKERNGRGQPPCAANVATRAKTNNQKSCVCISLLAKAAPTRTRNSHFLLCLL